MNGLASSTLLLIDDEEANLDLLEALLMQEGYMRLERCSDARSALDRFDAVRPDLVLLDLHMPHRSGLDILVDIRGRTPLDDYLPVLVLTADATPAARERALAGGARDFLTKPFDAVEVCLRVRNLLETRLMHSQQRAARQRAESSELRSSLLAESGRILAGSNDALTCMAQLARIVAPGIADFCLIDLAETDGDGQPMIALSQDLSSEDAQRAAAMIELHASGAGNGPGSMRQISDDIDSARLVREPLGGAGFMAFVRTMMRPPFEPEDRDVLRELARRATLTLENARWIAEAQQAVLARDQVLSVVAHDLRNPLTAIAANAELLRLQLPPQAPEKQRAMLERIERIAQRTHAQVEDLLEVARSRQGSLELKSEPIEPQLFLEEAAALLHPLARARGIALVVDRPTTTRRVRADGLRVVQVLSNLIGNALRFAPQGGSITVTCREDGDELIVTVADNGPGIPIDQIPHIFNSFWRNDASDRRGTGLGLLIARTIVEAHGGRIWLESPDGGGAAFSFSLPLVTQHSFDRVRA